MAIRAYRLTLTLNSTKPDAGTTWQTVTIATEAADEAVDLAQFYRSELPAEALCCATLTDADGAVVWSEPNGSELGTHLTARERG